MNSNIPCPVLVIKEITMSKELLKSNPNKVKITEKIKNEEKNNITETNNKDKLLDLFSLSFDNISLGCDKWYSSLEIYSNKEANLDILMPPVVEEAAPPINAKNVSSSIIEANCSP